jgi:hypothetical protein
MPFDADESPVVGLLKVKALAAHVRRHDLSFVEHVAILARGQRPRYAEAKVTNLTRLKPPREEGESRRRRRTRPQSRRASDPAA